MWAWIRDRLRDPEARHNDWVYRYEWCKSPEDALLVCAHSEWELVSTAAWNSGIATFYRRPREWGL
jgi:hypothetical protein